MTPNEWRLRKVGEFATRSRVINVSGDRLPPLSVTKGLGVILQSDRYKKQIATDLRKYVIARRGQFAFDPMSLYYGAIGQVAPIDVGLVSPDYVVFDVDGSVDRTFLNFALRWPEQIPAYESVAETGNQFGKRRRVYWSVFENLKLALPPLGEQRKIAAILSSMDEAIEATQAVIDQLQVVKKAMMSELLTRGLPGRHTRFKQTEIGEVPEEWDVVRLDSVAATYSGGTPSRDEPSNYGGKIPWVKSGEVNNRWIRGTEEMISLRGLENSAAKWVDAGSVLVAMYGATAGKVGRLGIRATTNQAVCAIKASASVVTDEFIYWCLLMSAPTLLRSVQGSGQPNLNAGMIRALLVPLPTWDEQEAIGQVLEGLAVRLEAEGESLSAAVAVKAAVMSVLLTGEVRVIPDEAAA